MGKAKIVSGGEDGKYTIKLDYGTDVRDERVEKLAERLQELAPKIDEAKAKLQAAKDKEVAAKVAAEQAIAVYVAATQAIPPAFAAVSAAGNALASISKSSTATAAEITAAKVALAGAEATYKAAQEDAKTKMAAQVTAAKELVEAKKKTAPLQLALDLLTDERKQVEKDKAYYAGLTLDETLPAWCADLTEDAEGEVATIEIPGENSLVLIKAGAEPGATVDGALVARELQSPEQVFWNAAVLPGWQKWKPTYRRGVITALDTDADTADVTLTDDKSSAQNLGINQTKTLAKVPVIYMTCNSGAFEVGDECVVRFDGMDWEKPQVVGFVDKPKACPGGIGIVFSDLYGQPLQGHTDSDGTGVMYCLTPKTLKGARTATGEWSARKLPKWMAGGKAVNADSTGRIYFNGIQGRDESEYPDSFADYSSVNERAYAVEDRFSPSIYRGGIEVATSPSPDAPLPFVLEWEDGEKYAAQIVPHYAGYTVVKIELLVGPLKKNSSDPVGPVVATIDMPANTRLTSTKISIHPSGRKARALSYTIIPNSIYSTVCKLEFDITPTSLSYTEVGCMQNRSQQTETDTPAAVQTTSFSEAGDSNNGSSVVEYSSVSYGRQYGLWRGRNPFATRTITRKESGSYVYAFGPRGENVDKEISGGGHTFIDAWTETYEEVYTSTWSTSYEGGLAWRHESSTTTGSWSVSASSKVIPDHPNSDVDGIFGAGSFSAPEVTRVISASGTTNVQTTGNPWNVGYVSESNPTATGTDTVFTHYGINRKLIFLDRYLGFGVAVLTQPRIVKRITTLGNTAREDVTGPPIEEAPSSRELVVKHRGATIMSLPIASGDDSRFVAYAASDPLTCSIVVNVQKLRSDSRQRLASWIYVVDDSGVKTIHDLIPGLPQDVCAQDNRLLITL